jgi:hypothetical protein
MMDKFYRVEGHSQIVKNPMKGTLLNTNTAEIKNARRRKSIKQEKEKGQLRLEQEVQDLRSEMSEIKSLLKQLVEK